MLTGPKRLSYLRTPITPGRPSSAAQPAGRAGVEDTLYDDDLDVPDDDGPMDFADVPRDEGAEGVQKEAESAGPVAASATTAAKAKSRFQRQRKTIDAAMPAPMGKYVILTRRLCSTIKKKDEVTYHHYHDMVSPGRLRLSPSTRSRASR